MISNIVENNSCNERSVDDWRKPSAIHAIH